MTTPGAGAASAEASEPPVIEREREFGNNAPEGSIGNGGIAVNQVTNDIYVTDFEGARVLEYTPTGELVLLFGKNVDKTKVQERTEQEAKHEPVTITETQQDICTTASGDECGKGEEGAGPGQFALPSGIAVDPATEDIYVGDGQNDRIQKFDSTGHYISQINGTTSTPPFYLPKYQPNIAFDSNGHLLALDWEVKGEEAQPGSVRQFDQNGAPTGLSFGPALFENEELRVPRSVAVDERGSVYVGRETSGQVVGTVVKFSSVGLVEKEFAGTANGRIVAVDPLSGSVFVADAEGGQEVLEFSGEGKLERKFSAAGIGVFGMAFDVGEGKLYVGYKGGVVVFGGFPLPAVGAASVEGEVVSGLTQSGVVLAGQVNPHGVETAYGFQYGTSPVLEGAATAGVISRRFSAVKVSAEVGVQPSTVYYYRVVAHSAFGGPGGTTVYGPTQSFVSPAVPAGVVTGGVSGVTQDSVVLSGAVDPGSVGAASDTKWCFEYGTSTAYSQGWAPLSPGDAGQGAGSVPVSFELAGLWPDTLYHYRLVAVNSVGLGLGSPACGTLGGVESDGSDGTFMTSVPPPPSVLTGSASEISATSAVISGTVDGYGVATTYEFDIGTDTSYGTRIFGSAGSAGGSHEFAVAAQGLQPGQTYHFRLVAANAYGTSDGADGVFTTPGVASATIMGPAVAPLLSTPIARFPKAQGGSGPGGPQKPKACARKPKRQHATCARRAHNRHRPAKKKARR